MLQVQNLNKFYGANHVLKDINFGVEAGEVIAIIGPSGSGKSTALRCLNGLETNEQGSIHFHGTTVAHTEFALQQLRQRVGMVFQNFHLFPHLTVLENISFSPIHVKKVAKSEAIQAAKTLLEKVGLANKAQAYPAQLSGGQKQRVAIARALAMEPELLLFDEPTSALDPEMVQEVLQVMKTLANQGMTMIVVTHEIGFAREVANRLIFMAEGEIVEIGDAKSVLERPQTQRLQQFLATVLK